jgi:hypothetical protein
MKKNTTYDTVIFILNQSLHNYSVVPYQVHHVRVVRTPGFSLQTKS